MPWKERTVEKLYWTIGEVAEELGVNNSSIRYWEKEVGTINPKRTAKGDRLYTRKEIEHLRTVQHLVKEKGYTLNGAKTQLRKPDPAEAPAIDLEQLRDSLLKARALAKALLNEQA